MTLFAYRRERTPLHRIPAGAKLLFLIALCIFTFSGGLITTAICLIITAVLFIVSGHHKESLKPVKFVLIIGIMVTLLRMLHGNIQEGVYAGALYTVRFLITAIAAQIIFETTSSLEIKEAVEALQNRIACVFPPIKKWNPALALSLSINFIPQVFATWNRVHTAAKARGVEAKKGPVHTTRAAYNQILAFFSCLLYQAETKRKALLNRSNIHE